MTDAMDRLRAAEWKSIPVVSLSTAEAIVSDLEAKHVRERDEYVARKYAIASDLEAEVARLTEEVQVGVEVIAGLTAEVERLDSVLTMARQWWDHDGGFGAADPMFVKGVHEAVDLVRRLIDEPAAMAGEAEEGTA